MLSANPRFHRGIMHVHGSVFIHSAIRCKGITTHGLRCGITSDHCKKIPAAFPLTQGKQYCATHLPEEESVPFVVRCKGTNSAGERCKMSNVLYADSRGRVEAARPLTEGKLYCTFHEKQAQGMQRCEGTTAAGSRCGITAELYAKSRVMAAYPLTQGSKYCTHHDPSPSSEPDTSPEAAAASAPKSAKKRAKPSSQDTASSGDAHGGAGGDDDASCCVCMDARKNAVLCHDGGVSHMCVCHGCAQSLERAKQGCPMCRAPIVAVYKVW